MIRAIVALDDKNGIARNGDLPWHLPQDLEYFKTQTKKHGAVIVMGRKTFETIGKTLPGRKNIVVSSSELHTTGVTRWRDLSQLSELEDAWVIGGEMIYRQAIDATQELYVTRVHGDFDCDQFFPQFFSDFKIVERGKNLTQDGVVFHFEVLSRVSPKRSYR